MRDLNKALILCATEDVMDYCPEFDGVKNIMVHCDKNVKPFKKLCFRSGNDSVVNDLVRRLQDYFVERNLIDEETKKPLPESLQTLRKVLVFLLANTDATYKYNMHDDTHISHIFEACPLIPKFLTVTLVWELQLDQLLYEALAYTPSWFSFQFFEAASESLKYIDEPKKILEMLEELIKALLISIERSSYVKMDAIDQKIIFNKMHDQAIILLRRFNTPDASKLEKMKKSEIDRYWGFSIKHLLQMVLFAFDLYESRLDCEPQIDVSVYKIGECFQKRQWTKPKSPQTVLDEELRIINAVLGTLQNCVMTVNITSFIEWVEVDLTPQLTLQQAVGEMAYKVRERINANASFEHGVNAILKEIEIRPRTLAQIVGEATMGNILRALDDASTLTMEEKKLWFDELFKRGTAALHNDECLDTIREHTNLMTKENCMQIMDCKKLEQACAMNESEDGDDHDGGGDDELFDDDDELNSILVATFDELSTEDLIALLQYRSNLFDDDSQVLMHYAQRFEQQVTEFLNKCTKNFELHTFLVLCLQHPFKLWSKFFTNACHVEELVDNFCETVKITLPASKASVDKVLRAAVKNRTTQPLYFPKIFAKLYFLIYQAEKLDFLAKFLNGHIKALLDEKDYASLLPLMKGLLLIATHDEKLNFEDLTTPMLAMISNVAENARWTPKTFESVRIELVTVAVDFIKETLNRFLAVISEKDRKFLLSRVRTACGPLTQYYFQRLITTDEQHFQSFHEFLLTDRAANETTILKFLKKILLCCTAAEFFELMANSKFHEYVPQALKQIVNEIKQNDSDEQAKPSLNYRYCLNTYLNFVNSVLDDDSKNWQLLESIYELIAAAPKPHCDEIFVEAKCLLKQLMEASEIKAAAADSKILSELKIKMSEDIQVTTSETAS